MADYYCDTISGSDLNNGTTPALAVADFFALLTNTHANVTLTGGDRVYLRSQAASVNPRVTMTASVTSYVGYKSLVRFIVDDGTHWPGDEGYFEWSFGTGAYNFYIGPWTLIEGGVHSVGGDYTLRIVRSNTTQNSYILYSNNVVDGHGLFGYRNADIYSEVGYSSNRGVSMYLNTPSNGRLVLENINLDLHCVYPGLNCLIAYSLQDVSIILKNWTFTNSARFGASDAFQLVSITYDAFGSVVIDNVDGSWFGPNMTFKNKVGNSYGGGMAFSIRNSPCGASEKPVADFRDNSKENSLKNGTPNKALVAYEGVSAETYPYQVITPASILTWLPSKNMPKLQSGGALLPDGITPWSLAVTPRELVSVDKMGYENPVVLAYIEKYHTGVTGTKTITFETAWQDTSVATGNGTTDFDVVDNTNFWIDVEYEDDLGNIHTETSIPEGVVAASTTTWTAQDPTSGNVIWDTNQFIKYKITYTTKNPIKQNTYFKVRAASTLTGTLSTVAASRILVDPDVALS